MPTGPSPLLCAVHNNAWWCAQVCAAHQGPGETSPLAWWHRRPAPPYYPNLVTLDPAADRPGLGPLLAGLAALQGHAVKDSFGRLDLAADGYRLLFEATWAWREASGAAAPAGLFRWEEARSPAALEAWETAWRLRSGLAEGPALYPPSLLEAPDVTFLSGTRDGEVVAGCAATAAHGVIGLACIFPGPAGHPEVVASLAAYLEARHPGTPLAGYESGDDLDCLRACGFRELGPLRVWLRDAGRSRS